MPDRLTALMEEAYAAAPPALVILHGLELRHPAWAESVYLVNGSEVDINLSDETGVTRLHVACAFDITPPGTEDNGPGNGKVSVDNVSGLLRPYLAQAVASGLAIGVTYRAWRSDNPNQPGDVITGLQLKAVTLTATRAEGTIGFPEIGSQAFPRRTYSQDVFPGIWAAAAGQ